MSQNAADDYSGPTFSVQHRYKLMQYISNMQDTVLDDKYGQKTFSEERFIIRNLFAQDVNLIAIARVIVQRRFSGRSGRGVIK